MKRIRRIINQLLSVIKPHARYYVEFVLGLVLIAQGIVETWPGDQLPDQGTFQFLTTSQAEAVLSVWQIVSGFLLVAGVSVLDSSNSYWLRRSGTFGGFMSLTYLTFLGIMSHAVNDLFWIASSGLALISGIMYIRLGLEERP